MSEWAITLPFRDPSDSLLELDHSEFEAIGDPEERQVARLVVRELLFGRRLSTVGDSFRYLEAIGADGRRRILDDAREAAGLERSEGIDDRERFEANQAQARRRSSGRDAGGKAPMRCAADGCSLMPMGVSGMPEPVVDRRWWCSAHRHLAGPDDHLPPSDVARIGPHFELIEAPSRLAQMRAKDERLAEDDRRRAEDRAAEARERAAVERAREARLGNEFPPGFAA